MGSLLAHYKMIYKPVILKDNTENLSMRSTARLPFSNIISTIKIQSKHNLKSKADSCLCWEVENTIFKDKYPICPNITELLQ